MKKILLIKLIVLLSFDSYSQGKIVVIDIRLVEKDLDAKLYEKKDQNNNKCAIIKIQTGEKGFRFDGGILGIVEVVEKTGEIWLYVPRKLKKLEIYHATLGNLKDYVIPINIDEGNVYVMEITYGNVKYILNEEIQTGFLNIKSNIEGANVEIDGKYIGITPIESLSHNEGNFEMVISKKNYITLRKKIEIKKAVNNKFDEILQFDGGSINISAGPFRAEIWLDGNKTKYITPEKIDKILTGKHNIMLIKDLYDTITKEVILKTGDNLYLYIDFLQLFYNLKITVLNHSDAFIYIDKQLRGRGNINLNLLNGVHFIEVKKEHYYDFTKNINIKIGDELEEKIELVGKVGNLAIITYPDDFEFKLNGVNDINRTPTILSNLIEGEHKIEIIRDGYNFLKTIKVKEGMTTELTIKDSITVENAVEIDKKIIYKDKWEDYKLNNISIITYPKNLEVKINGVKNFKKTPLTIMNNSEGNYKIEILRKGYNFSKEVQVKKGKTTELTIKDNITVMKEVEIEKKIIYKDNWEDYKVKERIINGIEFIKVEGGTFTMGCTDEPESVCDDDEKPSHSVTLSSFSIGKYEVTQAQWESIMGNNPSNFKNCDDCPVEDVSWDDIQIFLQKLNAKTGKNFRLPTEAEWEYAARGGNKSKGYKYSGSDNVESVAWYKNNSGEKIHSVGTKTANELGIYDMSGNVWERCSDWYGDYTSTNQTNPKGPNSGEYSVLRGGSWNLYATFSRISYRTYNYPSNWNFNNGFRLLLP